VGLIGASRQELVPREVDRSEACSSVLPVFSGSLDVRSFTEHLSNRTVVRVEWPWSEPQQAFVAQDLADPARLRYAKRNARHRDPAGRFDHRRLKHLREHPWPASERPLWDPVSKARLPGRAGRALTGDRSGVRL
jgi:hypothetical protein